MPSKMALAVLKDYGHILGALTRTSTAKLDAATFAAPGIAVRDVATGAKITVPSDLLEIREVDYNEDLLLSPQKYLFTDLPEPLKPSEAVSNITLTTTAVTVAFTALAAGVSAKYFIRVESESLAEAAVLTGQVTGVASVAVNRSFTAGSLHKVYAAVATRTALTKIITP